GFLDARSRCCLRHSCSTNTFCLRKNGAFVQPNTNCSGYVIIVNIPPKKYEKKVVACACGTLPVIRHTIKMTEINFFTMLL
ncbi:MAG: hypothetical protein LBB06_00650, partial [Endomicrobium sp.]|nr:hypothetical protein [Endomicrobium sp.]